MRNYHQRALKPKLFAKTNTGFAEMQKWLFSMSKNKQSIVGKLDASGKSTQGLMFLQPKDESTPLKGFRVYFTFEVINDIEFYVLKRGYPRFISRKLRHT